MTTQRSPNDLPPGVKAALEGKISPLDLEEDQQIIFYDLLAQRHAASKAEFAAKLLKEAGNVVYDEDDNLIKTLGSGQVEILKRSV